ncbi:MAG: hypothetical protein ACOYKA_00890 [Legionellaceae bacterium]
MDFLRWYRVLCLCLGIMGFPLFAADLPESPHFLPAESPSVRWVFSGEVSGESGERYGYFFQMDKDGSHFHSHAALFDAQTKAILLRDESEATIDEIKLHHWQVGRTFMRFNPINDTWVFGLKTKDKKGFNFKIDMASTADKSGRVETLRPGVSVLVGQTNLLNGHLNVADERGEQFVTAKHAWFRQTWMTASQATDHSIHGVLCRFDDGSAFYSVNLPEPDALRGALAGWFDSEGVAASMSQFIHIKNKLDQDEVDIRITSPERHVVLSLGLNQGSVMAGFTTGKTPGFCMLTQDLLLKA